MKKIFFSVAVATSLLAVACNNPSSTNQILQDTIKYGHDHTEDDQAADLSEEKGQPSLEVLVKNYLDLKNALTADDDKAASAAGEILAATVSILDKSKLTTEQSKIFADVSEDLKEHGEHIQQNASNIKHQREHFLAMSEDVYDLVKARGAKGSKLYLTHCPMYNDGRGANWLSETKEIKNPYYGKEMSTCGSVKEELN